MAAPPQPLGEIVEVQARLSERFGAHCWFVEVAFASGTLGHLDLTVAVRMDRHEGFQIYGENGSVLGADGHFYRRQMEAFADTVLTGAETGGATVEDGLASASCPTPPTCSRPRRSSGAAR